MLEPERVMALALARGVTADWFADASMGAVWQALVDLHTARRGIDPMLVADELRRSGRLEAAGGAEALEAIIEATPTTAHAGFYLDALAGDMLTRGIRKVFAEARDEIAENPVQAITEITKALRMLQERGAGSLEVDKLGPLEAKLAQWREVARQRFVLKNPAFCMGVPLPWACLNSVFTGLRPGLHVLGARTSVGKTVYALNVSQFWCERKIPHAFISLDMEEGELLTRYISAQARVSLRKLEWGARHEELEAAAAQIPVVDKACMHLTTLRQVERIEGWLHMAVSRWGIKAAVLDYVQLVRLKHDNRMRAFERVCEATQALKDIANTLGLPIVLLAQLSREVDKAERENVYAEPRLSDLGDSSELEKSAASVTLMHRDQIVEQYWRTNEPLYLSYGDQNLARHLRAMWLTVAKNQQGLAGVRRPFVMYPHQFILRPGCYETREAVMETVADKYTGKDKKVQNWRPAFARIRDDWRVLPEDAELESHGGLGEREFHEGE